MLTVTDVPMLALIGTLAAQCGALLIWGSRLTERVRVLEEDARALKGVAAAVAELRGRMDGMIEALQELNESIRWMREPAAGAAARRRAPRKETA